MTVSELSERRLIAIEGLPGSGHSEFAQWIGEQPNWYAATSDEHLTVPENGKASPLSPLLHILLERYERNQGLVGIDLFREHIVTDYIFETHTLWARTLLAEKEWDLYQKVATVVVPPPVNPDLVVYLQAPEDELLESLRVVDKAVGADRWQALITGFNHFFFTYERTPLLVIRTASSEWLGSEIAKSALLQRILSAKGAKNYLMGEADLWAGGQPTSDGRTTR